MLERIRNVILENSEGKGLFSKAPSGNAVNALPLQAENLVTTVAIGAIAAAFTQTEPPINTGNCEGGRKTNYTLELTQVIRRNGKSPNAIGSRDTHKPDVSMGDRTFKIATENEIIRFPQFYEDVELEQGNWYRGEARASHVTTTTQIGPNVRAIQTFPDGSESKWDLIPQTLFCYSGDVIYYKNE